MLWTIKARRDPPGPAEDCTANDHCIVPHNCLLQLIVLATARDDVSFVLYRVSDMRKSVMVVDQMPHLFSLLVQSQSVSVGILVRLKKKEEKKSVLNVSAAPPDGHEWYFTSIWLSRGFILVKYSF